MVAIAVFTLILVWFSGSFPLRKKDTDTTVKRRVYCSAQSLSPAWPGTAIPEPKDFKTWDGPKPISVLGSTGSIGTQVRKFNFPPI